MNRHSWALPGASGSDKPCGGREKLAVCNRLPGGSLSDIFISYNREDQHRAEQFVRGLEAAGLSVWWDASLRAGEVYDEVTEQALRTARAVVVLWSERSVASRWVRAEATLAQRLRTFVPCMIEHCERPIMFELTQTADLTHWRGNLEDPAWQAFVGHIRDVIEAGGGASPAPPAAAPTRPAPAAAQPGNERRQVTFLAGEIVDGQRLAMMLDPEDWHEMLVALAACFDGIAGKYGAAMKWNGHRFSCTFGFPVAQEDAAQRAIQAGLELVTQSVRGHFLPAGWEAGAIAVRVGIHVGEVLATINAQGEAELFGEGAAMAAHLRDRAGSGEVLASETVRALASRTFGFDPMPAEVDQDLAYRVHPASSATATVARPGSCFVGREDELHLINSRWRRALGGSSQLVMLRGEPGIGKTRLVEEFRAGLVGQEHFWLPLQGSSMFPNTPYHALGQMVQGMADEAGTDPSRALSARLADLGLSSGLADAILTATGLAESESAASSARTSDQQRARIQGTLVNALFELAQRRPLVVLADDLQWIDPSTLDVIEMLVGQADQDRILVLGTARPEFQPPWPEQEHHSRITLGRLSQADVREMVVQTLGEVAVATEDLAQLLERADGVPLFAEELARVLAEGEATRERGGLPSTLRALLAARMDRLGAAREVLQFAAVLGRSFPYDLLAEMTRLPQGQLEPMLQKVIDEQLLVVRGAPPAATYRFKHALLQDAAYETLPKRRQKELHRIAAETIVTRFPELASSQGEVLARHWTRAGAHAEAVAAWRSAGDDAFNRAASKEAAAHYRAGLALVDGLPDGSSRDETELSLWSSLNRALQLARGYSDPQTVEAAAKAVELAKKGGALARILAEEAQMWRAAITAGDYARADAVAEQVLAMAGDLDAANQLAWVDYFKANARVQTGFYAGRIKDFESDWAVAEATLGNQELTHSANDDVVMYGVGSLAAWMGGRSDLAHARITQALDLAQSSGQPYALAVTHHFAGTLTGFERDREGTLEHSRMAAEVCEANGYDYILHLVRAKLGWAGATGGISESDIAAMKQSLENMIQANALVGMIFNLNRLAIALEVNGQPEEALEITDQALALNPQERVAIPQTFEIRGRLLQATGDTAGAIESYRQGIALAAEMGTIALDLSLANHLAQLLDQQGDRAAALAVVRDTLSRCDAATNTPDLEPARLLAARLES